MAHTPLGPGGEFDRVRGIWRRLGARAAAAGDDCAFVQIGAERLAISSDIAIEGTHFLPGWLAFHELGWRVATAALSDLAAVAATPQGMLVSVGLSPELPEAFSADLMEGVGEAAAAVGSVVWGGDLVRSERLTIDAIVVGRLEREPVRRSGATPGDSLCVTGSLGGPAAALEAWRARREPDRAARQRFARPVARIAEAQWLRDHGARAMIDLSDGLAADAGHLAAASSVAAVIDLGRVPVHVAATGAEAAVTSGEEFELLVAVPARDVETIVREFAGRFDVPLTVVGRVDEGEGVRVERDGEAVGELALFRHF